MLYNLASAADSLYLETNTCPLFFRESLKESLGEDIKIKL